MSTRIATVIVGALAFVVFWVIRPDAPTPGSDCEVLTTWALREPVAAITSLAIIGAGWWVASSRPVAGSAVLLVGAASFAAHATAHPTARALDGIAAAVAITAVTASLLHSPPPPRRLFLGGMIGVGGLTVWLLSRTDAPLCGAIGPWGHGAWHLLVALAVVVGTGSTRDPDYDLPLTP